MIRNKNSKDKFFDKLSFYLRTKESDEPTQSGLQDKPIEQDGKEPTPSGVDIRPTEQDEPTPSGIEPKPEAPMDTIPFQESDPLTDADLSLINKLTLKPTEIGQVTSYTALLIDDRITRNNTQYPSDFQNTILSLPVGEGNFIGAPVLYGNGEDHQQVASAQVGRVYNAWQVTDTEGHIGVMAKLYILNEGNEELITKIDTGVIKELSIACSVELPICSICNQDIRSCEHMIGVDGCYAIMSGNGYCGEISFVAVPGSDQAKILSVEQQGEYANLAESLRSKFKKSIQDAKNVMDEIKKFMKEGSNIQHAKDHLPTPDELARAEKIKKELDKNKKDSDNKLGIVDSLIDTLEHKQIEHLDIMKTCREMKDKHEQDLKALERRKITLDAREKKLDQEASDRVNDIMKWELIKETVRLGILIDKLEIKDREAAEKFFKTLSYEQLKKIKDVFFQEGKSIFLRKQEIKIDGNIDNKEKSLRDIAKNILKKSK